MPSAGADDSMTAQESTVGPLLFLDDVQEGALHLAALFIAPRGVSVPPVEIGTERAEPAAIAEYDGAAVLRARFVLPADRPSSYRWNGERFDVAGDLGRDLRIAYVSCNGEEVGDLEREGSERNAMWARLRDEHRQVPFSLLLHGGDQVYADEVTDGHPLSAAWPEEVPANPSPAELADLRDHLRQRFFERYSQLFAAPEFAWIAARVPSLTQWDDHDICDGWGSLAEDATRSAVGQMLFSVARESCLVFQHAAVDGDLPSRFADPAGGHLGWCVRAPDLRLLAPDLRSERTRHTVMGDGGWSMMEAEAQVSICGQTFLMSSVPLLGPRLSILEALMVAVPRMQEYEDDLRDQWQSRAHRDEWRRMLSLVCGITRCPGRDVTAVSGEIHLATRAEMALDDGRVLHQLVASGIAHRPPPQAWARVLGLLAWAGEDPLPAHPIRIERIPGQPRRYVAERNYLVLERQDGAWRALWEFEHGGRSPSLALTHAPAGRRDS